MNVAAELQNKSDLDARTLVLKNYANYTELKGLEIGPGCRPLLNPANKNSFFLDHLSQADLREKYKDHAHFQIENIPFIHYVAPTADFSAIKENPKFDFIVAAHVIEHIPSPIQWLSNLHSVLSDDGFIFLVVPDKRYTFDYNRRISTYGDLISAEMENLKKPSFNMIFDHFTHVVKNRGYGAWNSQIPIGDMTRFHSDLEAIEAAKESLNKYIDVHCWVFDPNSFVNDFQRLIDLQKIQFEIVLYTGTPNILHEFYVVLKKKKSKPNPTTPTAVS